MSREVPVYDYFAWQNPVKDIANSPPAPPSVGDRYIVGATPSGAFSGRAKDIATYTGAGWEFFDTIEGMACWVDDEDKMYFYDGSSWIAAGGDLGPTGPTGPTGAAGSSGAPTTAQYVCMTNEATLSAERRLQPGYCMQMIDNGANGDVTLVPHPYGDDDPYVPMYQGGNPAYAQSSIFQSGNTRSGHANIVDSSGVHGRLTTDAVNNASAYMYGQTNLVYSNMDMKFFSQIRTGNTIASANLWLGFSEALPGNTSSHTWDCITFRYSASVGGNWYAYCRDDDAGNETVEDTGVAVVAETEVFLRIDVVDEVAYFYIDNVLTNTISTNLPPTANQLSWSFSVYTKEAVAKHFHYRGIGVWKRIRSNDDG